jgi:ubiquinol-cytochrome c reductase cytochrome c1 subunit
MAMRRALLGSKLLVGAATTAFVFGDWSVDASHAENATNASFPWSHAPMTKGYDHNSLRRGYEVYRQVCSTCHSINLLAFRNLIGVSHTEEQVVALAKSFEVQDGFGDDGEPYMRPGKPSDKFPAPYPNVETARFANGGAVPPDLSLIVKMRGEGEDSPVAGPNYIFSLLTGFSEPPHGMHLLPGQHYNVYFDAGRIAMAPPLVHEGIEYEDGVVASESQQAKDVTTFLCWAGAPEHDTRKQAGLLAMGAAGVSFFFLGYHKRWRWSFVRHKRVTYIPPVNKGY